MAGVPGFEPGNAGIKNRCLTAWRYPNTAENRKIEEIWLGYLDSNQGMPVSKTGALPLGDTPIPRRTAKSKKYGWGTWIRTRECRYQKPVPYRLAIPHPCNAYLGMVREARLELAHLAAPEPKSGASTNFATPAKKMVATTGFEPVTPSL